MFEPLEIEQRLADEKFRAVLYTSLFIRYKLTWTGGEETLYASMLGGQSWTGQMLDRAWCLKGTYNIAGKLSNFTPRFEYATDEARVKQLLETEVRRWRHIAVNDHIKKSYSGNNSFVALVNLGGRDRLLKQDSDALQFHHGILAQYMARELMHLRWMTGLEGQVSPEKVTAFETLEKRFGNFVDASRHVYLERHFGE